MSVSASERYPLKAPFDAIEWRRQQAVDRSLASTALDVTVTPPCDYISTEPGQMQSSLVYAPQQELPIDDKELLFTDQTYAATLVESVRAIIKARKEQGEQIEADDAPTVVITDTLMELQEALVVPTRIVDDPLTELPVAQYEPLYPVHDLAA